MNKKIQIFFVGLIICVQCIAQNAKEDFLKINKAYLNRSLSMKVHYEVFKKWEDNVPLEKEEGEIKTNGIYKYTKTGNIETVQNKDYYVIVDHEDKQISLLGTMGQEPKPDERLIMINLDSAIQSCTQVEFHKENKQQNSYTLVFPISEYQKVKIIFNKNTFLIEKMILHYREAEEYDDDSKFPPRLEITYYDIDTNPTFAEDTFTSNRFLKKENKKYYCRDEYKGYKLTNLSFNN